MTVRVSWRFPVRVQERVAHFVPQRKKFQKKSFIDTLDTGGCTTPTCLVSSNELTTSRCNEPENLAMRYRKFKVSALVDAAVNAVGDDATSCKIIFSSIPKLRSFRIEPNIATISGVKLLKCTEGQYNMAFLMTMDNGAEVLAKIPNPNAGPAFYTTASEVATRHFVCDLSRWCW